MAMNIKDPETERLAAEAAELTGDSKTGAVRQALREFVSRHGRRDLAARRHARLVRVLEEEIWPLIPADQLGVPVSKAEREEILGYGPDGV